MIVYCRASYSKASFIVIIILITIIFNSATDLLSFIYATEVIWSYLDNLLSFAWRQRIVIRCLLFVFMISRVRMNRRLTSGAVVANVVITYRYTAHACHHIDFTHTSILLTPLLVKILYNCIVPTLIIFWWPLKSSLSSSCVWLYACNSIKTNSAFVLMFWIYFL